MSDFMTHRVSGCVIVAYRQVSSFSAISWWEQVTFRSHLYGTSTPIWTFIVLSHWNNSLQVDMLPHWDTLFWLQANQSLLICFNAACLAEKQQILNIIVVGLTLQGLEPTIYFTRGGHANHCTTDEAQSHIEMTFETTILFSNTFILL
jgi:hypothetical protein